MKPLTAFALDASTPPAGRGDGAASPQGWLRELQKRAQAQSWFPAPLEPTNQRVATASPPTQVGRAVSIPARGPGPDHGEREAVTVAMRSSSVAGDAFPAAQRLHGGYLAAPGAAADPVLPLAGQPRTIESGAIASVIDRRSAPLASREWMRTPETPGVRVHVDEADAGVHVWLGVDMHDPQLAAQAASILATVLAGSRSATQRLAALVCNGTTLYADSRAVPSLSSQEQPWPSAH